LLSQDSRATPSAREKISPFWLAQKANQRKARTLMANRSPHSISHRASRTTLFHCAGRGKYPYTDDPRRVHDGLAVIDSGARGFSARAGIELVRLEEFDAQRQGALWRPFSVLTLLRRSGTLGFEIAFTDDRGLDMPTPAKGAEPTNSGIRGDISHKWAPRGFR
jgi:hypothetical protein